jgi:hypothetical protein
LRIARIYRGKQNKTGKKKKKKYRMAFIRLVIAIIVQFPAFCSLAVGGFRIFWLHNEK